MNCPFFDALETADHIWKQSEPNQLMISPKTTSLNECFQAKGDNG
jgi:hypothetical protein